MSISPSMITMVRVLINDLAASDYNDCRLEQTIVVAASLVQQDLGITTYTIDIEGQNITPNPVSTGDAGFVNLVVLKTGCIIDQGSLRTRAALVGLSARCGPASLTTGGALEGYKTLVDLGVCKLYKDMLLDYKLHGNGGTGLCHAILSPFISADFDPQAFIPYYNNDDLFR